MSKRVLIVDDEADIRSITQLALEMATDWVVLTAGSGPEALTIAARDRPDVILLDLMMPAMDGRATLQQLQQNQVTQAIPVILVTAKAVAKGDRFGDLAVAAVLAKPFRPLQLATEIKEILGWT